MNHPDSSANATAPSERLSALDKLLRGELAAAATYEQAERHLDDPATRPLLAQIRASHSTRAVMLAQLVRKAGADPSETAGPWGAFTKLVEQTAAVIGDQALLKVLLEGEKHGTAMYEREMDALDGDQLWFVNAHGLAEQKATENRMNELVT